MRVVNDGPKSDVLGHGRRVLGVGVIGCGYAAERLHLPALQSLRIARVVALADTDSDRLAQIGRKFGVAHRYPDYETLLQSPEVDAVGVCVPPLVHARVALAALDAKKHVLVEKPLCLDVNEAHRLVEHAERCPVVAMMGFNLRYHRHVRAARQAIACGLLGTVELVRTVWSSRATAAERLPAWRRCQESGGGVLHELAVHHVDLWSFLLGSEVEEVFAWRPAGSRESDTTVLTARSRDGVLTVSSFSQHAGEAHEIVVYGDGGRLRVSPYRFDGFEIAPPTRRSGDFVSRLRSLAGGLRAFPSGISTLRRGGAFLDSYRCEWQHFAEHALTGRPCESPLRDGQRALELVLGAVESSRTGRPVDVSRRRGSPGATVPRHG